MKYSLVLEGPESINLNNASQQILSWIYSNLKEHDKSLANKLHSFKENVVDGYSIKPLNFSRLYRTKKGYGLKISTLDINVAKAINNLILNPLPLVINGSELRVVDYGVNVFMDSIIYFTLSPILVRYKDKYCFPSDKKFMWAINHNLKLKYKAITGQEIEEDLQIFKMKEEYKTIKIKFKNHDFYGVVGEFIMKGDYRLCQTAYYLGVGSHTASGFGCIETVKPKSACS